MIWPLIQPFKTTCLWLLGLIVVCTVFAPLYKAKRIKAFRNTIIISLVLFIPSCSLIQSELDAKRFGLFDYKTYAEVQDRRVEFYLPTAARDITLFKELQGHHAKYKISEEDFHAYLDVLWERGGERSTVKRSDGVPANDEDFEITFKDVNWKPLKNTSRFHSPVAPDGGGATYYFDTKAGIVYHRAGYW